MATLQNTDTRSALSRYDLSWDAWMARAYSINWEAVLYAVIFILAVATRFYELGERVMSHDESLHTYYSYLLYDRGEFSHTPLMHGPLLFHMTAFFYFLFGDNDFTARIYTAGLGIAIVMFPLLFRRWLGKTGAILAAVGLLVSPMMLYYSRYIRHDIPNIFFALIMIYCIVQYIDGVRPRRPMWLVIFSGAMVLMLASKEVAFFYIAIFGSFLTAYWALRNLQVFGGVAMGRPNTPTTERFKIIGGHIVLALIAVFLGYFAGYMVYYWHFAEVGWQWVAVIAALVALAAILIKGWQLLGAALASNRGRDVAFLTLVSVMCFTLIVFIWGLVSFQAADSALVIDAGMVDTLTTQQRLDYESQRDRGLLAALVATVLFALGAAGFVMAYIFWDATTNGEAERRERVGWLITTTLVVVGAAFLMAVAKLITSLSFEYSGLISVLMMVIIFIALEGVTLLRAVLAGAPRPGLGYMLMDGLVRGRSAMGIVIAGTVLAAALSIYAYGVLDIIKPEQVWVEEDITEIQEVDGISQPVPTGETEVTLNARLGSALLAWLGIPIIAVVALVFVVAAVQTPRHLPLPWGKILALLLVMALTGGVLTYIERHSLETESETAEEPVAVDPEAGVTATDSPHDNVLLLGLGLVLVLLSIGIVLWRVLLPDTWLFMKREASFDILIMMGTMTLPWLAAYPIFMAGYELDVIPPPSGTLTVMILFGGLVWLLSATIGLAWNPRVWALSTAVFIALFVFFFTTVFTNGVGVFTGMIGSLGYWLEQQGVRRGSQPQYYYSMIQVPVYEFMPLILALIAGLAGLANVFRPEKANAIRPAEGGTAPLAMSRVIQDQATLDQIRQMAEAGNSEAQAIQDALADDAALEITEEELLASYAEADAIEEDVRTEDSIDVRGLNAARKSKTPHWARPYDHDEELSLRENQRDWLGGFPFLQFVAFWGVIMFAGLTIAGEKMPWLTVHITLPLIYGAAWYGGRVIEGIRWESIRKGGWALLLVLVPVAIVSLFRVVSPLVGGNAPFEGQSQAQLASTYAWLAAAFVLAGVVYFIFRIMADIGWGQTMRLSYGAVAILLTFLTARVAVMANYENYDLANEYLVYAHSGPAVQWVMDEVEYFADRTNEGYNLRVAYDDDSSWPMTWYLRDYNTAFFAGEADALESNPGVLDDASIIVVGNRKNNVVDRLLGDDYYRFDYIRLWWPMQEYFNLNFDRVANVFENGADNPAARLYRDGMWDIWWNRDYSTYAQAQCVENQSFTCQTEADVNACYTRVINECADDDRYDINSWPVSDALYLYVDKEIAAQIWDAGIGGETVASREPLSVIDEVYRELEPLTTFGTELSLAEPRGIDVAPNGNVYVADTNNSRVMVFDPQGNFLFTFGSPSVDGIAAEGNLNQPWGIAVGDDERVYVADTWNNRVQVFSLDGQPITRWGQYGVPSDGENPFAFWGPRDVTIDNAGNVLVADTGGKRIRVYSPDGEWLRDLGTGTEGTGLGQLNEPVGLAVNPVNGNVYVADTWNQRVHVFTEAGTPLRTFDVPMWFDSRSSVHRPYLAVSPDGSLLAVSDMSAEGRNDGPRIVVYDVAGNPLLALNAPETDFNAGLHGIRIVAGLQFDTDGSLYALDAETNRVVKFASLPVASGLIPAGAGAGAVDSGEGASSGLPDAAPPSDEQPAGVGAPDGLPNSLETPLEADDE